MENSDLGSTDLQTEIYRTGQIPMELNPANRPLVLSQPAPNRREWALRVLGQGYRDTGKTNTSWDRQVHAALEEFCTYTRVDTKNWSSLKQALAAVPAACNDPMIEYMRVRYGDNRNRTNTALKYLRAHEGMIRSKHHPLFKFMAGWRASEMTRNADRTSNRETRTSWTTIHLEDLARDTNAPVDEVFDAAGNWLHMSRSKEWIEYVTSDLERILENNFGKTARWFRFRGEVEIERAWGDRGGDFADKVTTEGWQGFKDHLDRAEESLSRAWETNSKDVETAYLMMRLELGQGQGLSRMEIWFNRVMNLNPRHFEAATLMSFYLEPRWYGSEGKALAFGRSCVESEKWGGSVPLVLANLHHSLSRYYHLSNSPAYWHRSGVWSDMKSSYDKFFQLNPTNVSTRNYYARDAYYCGQYGDFLEQAGTFSDGTNFAFFGGRKRFEEMLSRAAQSTQTASP